MLFRKLGISHSQSYLISNKDDFVTNYTLQEGPQGVGRATYLLDEEDSGDNFEWTTNNNLDGPRAKRHPDDTVKDELLSFRLEDDQGRTQLVVTYVVVVEDGPAEGEEGWEELL